MNEVSTQYKGLTVQVYRTHAYNYEYDALNKVTRLHDLVLLIGKEVPEVTKDYGDVPVLKLVHRNIFGEDYIHAEPVDPAHHYCFGGNFIFSSDSRFSFPEGNRRPIPVHDRIE